MQFNIFCNKELLTIAIGPERELVDSISLRCPHLDAFHYSLFSKLKGKQTKYDHIICLRNGSLNFDVGMFHHPPILVMPVTNVLCCESSDKGNKWSKIRTRTKIN